MVKSNTFRYDEASDRLVGALARDFFFQKLVHATEEGMITRRHAEITISHSKESGAQIKLWNEDYKFHYGFHGADENEAIARAYLAYRMSVAPEHDLDTPYDECDDRKLLMTPTVTTGSMNTFIGQQAGQVPMGPTTIGVGPATFLPAPNTVQPTPGTVPGTGYTVTITGTGASIIQGTTNWGGQYVDPVGTTYMATDGIFYSSATLSSQDSINQGVLADVSTGINPNVLGEVA